MASGRSIRQVAAALTLAMAAAARAPAQAVLQQDVPARLVGHVVDRATRSPVRGAEVGLPDRGRLARSDSAGRFAFLGLDAGVLRIRVRAVGWQPVDLDVYLRAGRELERVIELDAVPVPEAQPLGAVTVRADAPNLGYRLADFERRRRTGRGHYLTEDAIVRTGASTLVDATRGLRGVTQECGGRGTGGDGGCRMHMARAKRNCQPDYVVDGRVENMFGPTTPVRDIVALEIYTGASDVPGEFAGSNADCGVVVIWTRAGPTRVVR